MDVAGCIIIVSLREKWRWLGRRPNTFAGADRCYVDGSQFHSQSKLQLLLLAKAPAEVHVGTYAGRRTASLSVRRSVN
jgi:hypothetical protein